MPGNPLNILDERLAENGIDAVAPFKQCVAPFKQCIGAADKALAKKFAAGKSVDDLVRLRAEFVDELLRRAWRLFLQNDAEASLIAVGGYGRAELHPASDIDVLILTGDDPEIYASALERFVTLLWDIGLEIGHSVRSVEQCVIEAKRDVTVITNLIESRPIAGRLSLYDAMRAATAPDAIWPSAEFFSAKLAEQERRHAKFDDTAYNLEPNIKENPGGLRDIQMIGWVAKRHFGAKTMADLVTHGFLTDSEFETLMAGQAELWRIRFALHLLTGRHEDRLLFDHQRALATSLGYEDEKNNLGVERFMQTYYRSVMRLNRLNEMLLQLFQEAILLRNELGEPIPINRRFQVRNGYLEVRNAGIFARKPLAMMEIFLLLQQHENIKGVRAATIRLIRAHRHLIDRRFRRDKKARRMFMDILRQPRGITLALQRMNRYGILARYIPAFGNIVGRMQYDLFHVYTVDEHTLRVVRNLRRYAIPQFAHEFPLCSRVFLNLPKPELLYLAGIFHDIAKGRGGSHSALGAEDALEFCKLHRLPNDDADLVRWLVANHLLMSTVAQRKDIEDTAVTSNFAEAVGDLNHLNYLYLLTVADIRATNPDRWNSWKGSLLGQLYNKARRALTAGLETPEEQVELVATKQEEARSTLLTEGFGEAAIRALWRALSIDYFVQASSEEIVWQSTLVLERQPDDAIALVEIREANRGGATEIFIYADDRDDMFAHTTALLDQLGLNVVAARIETADVGFALNNYFVLEENGDLVSDPARQEEIAVTLRIGLAEPESFDPTLRRRVPRHLQHFSTPTKIEFSEDHGNQRTELRLRADDRPGLLSRVGQAFAECRVRVHGAKITTLGAIAEDTYYVTDQQNRPLSEEQAKTCLANAIRKQLED